PANGRPYDDSLNVGRQHIRRGERAACERLAQPLNQTSADVAPEDQARRSAQSARDAVEVVHPKLRRQPLPAGAPEPLVAIDLDVRGERIEAISRACP